MATDAHPDPAGPVGVPYPDKSLVGVDDGRAVGTPPTPHFGSGHIPIWDDPLL